MDRLNKLVLITCNRGDWEVLKGKINNSDIFIEGHSLTNNDWIEILKILKVSIDKTIISDEDMELGNY